MKLYFGPTIILLVFTAVIVTTTMTTVEASSSIRGPSQEEEPQQQQPLEQVVHRRRRRRLSLPANTECVFYIKDTQWEDGHHDQECACEFTTEQATYMEAGLLDTTTSTTGDGSIVPMITIDSSNATTACSDYATGGGLISGGTIIRSSDFTVEQSSDTGEMKLIIPDAAQLYVLQELSEDDSRHYKARRTRRRAVALQSGKDVGHNRTLASSTGTFETLVVRVEANKGAQPAASEMQLYDDIFDDKSSLKSQYYNCSKSQMNIIPAEGYGASTAGTKGDGNSDRTGIVTVTVDIDVDETSREPLEKKAFTAATKLVGGTLSNFDLVIFCQPPGSGGWIGYAYVNDYRSFYNDIWCSQMSALVHEVGHNLGLDHSGMNTNGVVDALKETYGDASGMMGLSFQQDDGPDKCFNAAKNWQLGWYDNQKESYNPLNNNIGQTKQYIMNGINEYEVDGSSNGELITLRLENESSGRDDYYIGYNRANGANSGTSEAKNMILIVRKPCPDPNKNCGPDEYGESKKESALTVGQSFTIERYRDSNENVIITYESVTSNLRDATISVRTTGTAPTNTPTNVSTLAPTNAPTVLTTKEPTTLPTKKPTASPTKLNPSNVDDECTENEDFRFKNKKKKDCNWIVSSTEKISKRKKRRKKVKKICKKKQKVDGKKQRIYKWCPTACATVKMGACKTKF